ncbi:GFA family protein [Maritalea porphyrae]|jgi:hypothetical protein|uniref:GFA family protein n=1 Tax=Maritalea porphyrae TaxID=880732 RepID=UPI0022B01C3A|nr:GFA family protein [Maritalea porphyrae]MCZ4272728.1 GFA family protein [Maritalea porphyrae]
MSNLSQNGRCLCGGIVYSVTSEPIHTTICHCKMCQRSTGSAYLLEPIFMKESVSVTEGATTVYEHISDMSDQALWINFCGNCGTKLFQTFARFPEVVGVFGGTFDNPDWFARTPENTRHIFTASAVQGDLFPAHFQLYRQHTSDSNTGKKNTPYILKEHREVE